MKYHRSLKRIEHPALPAPAFARTDAASEVGGGARKLLQLSEEADGLLTRLARLRQNLGEIREAMHDAKAQSTLAEANEQLALVALHAESVAETAVSELGELAR